MVRLQMRPKKKKQNSKTEKKQVSKMEVAKQKLTDFKDYLKLQMSNKYVQLSFLLLALGVLTAMLSGPIFSFFTLDNKSGGIYQKAENFDENFTVLNVSNFKEVAFDESKKVFVMFQQPGSNQSRYLNLKLQELEKAYDDNDDVIVAKTYVTANEVEEIGKTSIFKLFQSGEDAEVVDYNGKFNIENFKDFIESNGILFEEEEEDLTEEELFEEEEFFSEMLAEEEEDTEQDYSEEQLSNQELPEGVVKEDLAFSSENVRKYEQMVYEIWYKNPYKVFVMYNNPGNKLSRHVDSIWQELERIYENNDDVVIAKIDVTEKKFDGIDEPPFFKLYQSGKYGEFVDYYGRFTVENFKMFIETNGNLPDEEKEDLSEEEFAMQEH